MAEPTRRAVAARAVEEVLAYLSRRHARGWLSSRASSGGRASTPRVMPPPSKRVPRGSSGPRVFRRIKRERTHREIFAISERPEKSRLGSTRWLASPGAPRRQFATRATMADDGPSSTPRELDAASTRWTSGGVIRPADGGTHYESSRGAGATSTEQAGAPSSAWGAGAIPRAARRHRASARSIDASNVGFRMLQKAGWKEGEGLGKHGTGATEPLVVFKKRTRRGVGGRERRVARRRGGGRAGTNDRRARAVGNPPPPPRAPRARPRARPRRTPRRTRRARRRGRRGRRATRPSREPSSARSRTRGRRTPGTSTRSFAGGESARTPPNGAMATE